MTNFDDQLRAELDRRADAVDLPREWARQDLLPAVMSSVETRPQKVASSRAPAFAGLAAAVAIVLILVVAMPRLALGPGPGQTVEPTPAAEQPTPIAAGAWSAEKFAIWVQAGNLRGMAAVVDGAIGERPASSGVDCHVPLGETCLMGPLVRADPPLDVVSRWRATDERDPLVGPSDEIWPWAVLPTGPVEGKLVLNVDQNGTVEYIGTAANDVEHPGTVADVGALDPSTWDPDSVFLVNGWLDWMGQRECPESTSDIAGLPGRGCSVSSLIDPSQGPGGHIVVQDGAYPEFAPNPDLVDDSRRELRRAIYAVSSRLEGSCGEAEAPCWLWNVVGRLSGDLEEALRPPATTRQVACDPGGNFAHIGSPTISDEMDLILSCSVDAAESNPGREVQVSNPNGEMRRLKVAWQGMPCDIASSWVMFPGPEGPVLNGVGPAGDCEAMAVPHAFTLTLNRVIDSETVSALFTRPGPFPSPTPHLGDHTCGTRGVITITDETGFVDHCEDASSPADRDEPLIVDNLDGDTSVLRLTWAGLCSLSNRFTLRPTDHGVELVVWIPPAGIICDGFPMSHDVKVYLTSPIPRSDLQVTYKEMPDATPEPVASDVHWELALSERPTDEAERLRLLVYQDGCPEHTIPSGLVRDPQITYHSDAVTITFSAVARDTAECPESSDTATEVVLDEPLGDRVLVDGGDGNSVRVIVHEPGLLRVGPQHAFVAAPARFSWLLGEGACPQEYQRPPVDESSLVEAATTVAGGSGMLGDGASWYGDLEDAVRGFGGFELYSDPVGLQYMIAFAEGQSWLPAGVQLGDLVLADLRAVDVEGQPVWLPGTEFLGSGGPGCHQTVDASGQVRSSVEAGDFSMSISAPSVIEPAGQPLQGIEATFEYTGSESTVTLVGSGAGYAYMTPGSLDGNVNVPLAITDDCRPYQVASGQPQLIPFLGSSATDGQSPTLLPGVYRLSVHAEFYVGECGGPITRMNTSIFIRVR